MVIDYVVCASLYLTRYPQNKKKMLCVIHILQNQWNYKYLPTKTAKVFYRNQIVR